LGRLKILLCLTGVVIFILTGASYSKENKMETAVFAGGCFWCVEHAYDEVEGVISTVSGYIGGHKENPSYEEVSMGRTGHAEAVQVVYDPGKVSYQELLSVFWRNIDPTTPNRQFCDKGSQYRSAIFYLGETQKEQAEESKRALDKSKPFPEPIVTEIVEAGTFYPAEEYHQDYHYKNPVWYKLYRYRCGRDKRLEKVWGGVHHG